MYANRGDKTSRSTPQYNVVHFNFNLGHKHVIELTHKGRIYGLAATLTDTYCGVGEAELKWGCGCREVR